MLKFRYSDFIKAIFLLFFSIVIFIVCVGLFYEESYYYKKNDFFEYQILTLGEVKEMPFISENYKIYYYSPDGTQRLTNGVIFYHSTPDRKFELIKYIEQLGFQQYEKKPFSEKNKNEFWIKGNNEVNIVENEKDRTIDISFIK
ncbi:hypothetical protein PEC301937_25910 [Pectobacterium carotovorum subsp. carotovorum]|uniref:hypothetical protein n=1 Tax=Pectobacterium actinidiae TaxID=1507808 RepID=UPI002A7FFC0E|nr:hypothetical protein [Pectobacterium actinidiae]MDY4316442.1 hypothetical protein [Pectobacterium actinidiae]GKW16642.1 hypothetical protein PEC301937_25910 [Pectobacterium carotovorum subsp. carotovorum]